MKTLKVEIMHRGAERRKFRVIGISRLGANQLTFPVSFDLCSSKQQHILEIRLTRYISTLHSAALLLLSV